MSQKQKIEITLNDFIKHNSNSKFDSIKEVEGRNTILSMIDNLTNSITYFISISARWLVLLSNHFKKWYD